jgi:hypothetical protein
MYLLIFLNSLICVAIEWSINVSGIYQLNFLIFLIFSFLELSYISIRHLVVLIDNIESRRHDNLRINVFERIFALFTNLKDLDFGQSIKWLYPMLAFNDLSGKSCFSSTIVNLRIDVETFNECLNLLDGRLGQLRTFIVRINIICNSKLPNTVRALFILIN